MPVGVPAALAGLGRLDSGGTLFCGNRQTASDDNYQVTVTVQVDIMAGVINQRQKRVGEELLEGSRGGVWQGSGSGQQRGIH